MDAVSVSHLSKIYPGGTEALADVSFKIGRGRVFCLLGRNGAGKTTLLRILATQLRPSAGNAAVLGYDWIYRAAVGFNDVYRVQPRNFDQELEKSKLHTSDSEYCARLSPTSLLSSQPSAWLSPAFCTSHPYYGCRSTCEILLWSHSALGIECPDQLDLLGSFRSSFRNFGDTAGQLGGPLIVTDN